MALVVDASVGLKWALSEPDSHLASAFHLTEPDLIMPDFWLHEATNVLWRQVRRKLFTITEAREALSLLKVQIEPTLTAHMNLHERALDIGLAINHSTYDTMYVALALAVGAAAVVVADGGFVRDMQSHPDTAMAATVLPLDVWARSRGIAS